LGARLPFSGWQLNWNWHGLGTIEPHLFIARKYDNDLKYFSIAQIGYLDTLDHAGGRHKG
jgi:hypothetical protein